MIIFLTLFQRPKVMVYEQPWPRCSSMYVSENLWSYSLEDSRRPDTIQLHTSTPQLSPTHCFARICLHFPKKRNMLMATKLKTFIEGIILWQTRYYFASLPIGFFLSWCKNTDKYIGTHCLMMLLSVIMARNFKTSTSSICRTFSERKNELFS